jgi:hypothetical protein
LAWCALLVVDVLMLWRTWGVLTTFLDTGSVPFVGIFGGIVFLMMIMLTASVLILNVYIPTDIGNWINNATSMVFKAPLQLLLTAVLMWLPVILIPIYMEVIVYFITAIVAVYYTLVAFLSTILLKKVLMEYLQEARAEGALLAEEGKAKDTEEDA